MEAVLSLIASLSRWCRGHLYELALGLMAALLVLLAPIFNGWIRRRIGGLNSLLRTLLFGLLYVVVYGLAMVWLTPWLMTGMGHLSNYSLAPLLLLAFVLIGVAAERR